MNIVEARLEREDGGLVCRVGGQASPCSGRSPARPALESYVGRTVGLGDPARAASRTQRSPATCRGGGGCAAASSRRSSSARSARPRRDRPPRLSSRGGARGRRRRRQSLVRRPGVRGARTPHGPDRRSGSARRPAPGADVELRVDTQAAALLRPRDRDGDRGAATSRARRRGARWRPDGRSRSSIGCAPSASRSTRRSIYVGLLRHGPQNGNEVSKSAGLPSSKVYSTLERLVSKGIVQSVRPRLEDAVRLHLAGRARAPASAASSTSRSTTSRRTLPALAVFEPAAEVLTVSGSTRSARTGASSSRDAAREIYVSRLGRGRSDTCRRRCSPRTSAACGSSGCSTASDPPPDVGSWLVHSYREIVSDRIAGRMLTLVADGEEALIAHIPRSGGGERRPDAQPGARADRAGVPPARHRPPARPGARSASTSGTAGGRPIRTCARSSSPASPQEVAR